MPRLNIVADGVLYRNPRPGYRAECASLPNVVPLSESEVLCFYRIGQAFYSTDGRIAKLRSKDGGLTWRQEGLVWDPADDEATSATDASSWAARCGKRGTTRRRSTSRALPSSRMT